MRAPIAWCRVDLRESHVDRLLKAQDSVAGDLQDSKSGTETMGNPTDPNGLSPREQPVFVLGCAWRCGSTLVQRTLSSSPDLFIWGENAGLSALLREIRDRVAGLSGRSAREWDGFRKDGTDAWIACLNPPFPDALREALRGFYFDYFARAAEQLGKKRWGFKEVRHGVRTAAFLAELFPGSRIVFLLRNPVDVVASMSTMSWYGTEGRAHGVLETWRRNSDSMMRWSDERLLVVRYESLVHDSHDELERIARHVDLPAKDLDPSPLSQRVRGFQGQPTLGVEECRALQRAPIRDLAERLGYDISSDPRMRLRSALPATVYLRARGAYLAARRVGLQTVRRLARRAAV